MPKIFVINKSDNPLPEHQTESSAGADIHAYLPDGDVIIAAGEKEIIPTGIYIEIPVGYEVQVRPRSGLAFKYGVTVLNSPGTIDADYRGEVKVLLINHGKEAFVVKSGERIAQMVFSKYQRVEWESVNRLSDTERGSGGYGSSGK
ncbi:MAG: dUTP diphosphatase [Bacteroidia bacterium]